MTSSWRVARSPSGFVDGEPPGELFKFVCDGKDMYSGPAPDDDSSLMHADLIAELEETRGAAAVLRNLVIGWIWVDEPQAIYDLAYDDHDSNIEALLLEWLEHGRPARFAAAPASPCDPS